MAEKRFLSKAEILEAPDLPTEELEVPEWKTWVRVRGLDGRGRTRVQQLFDKMKDAPAERISAITHLLVALSVVDDAGDRVFPDQEIPSLAKKSPIVLERIAVVASRLSGMSPEAVEEARKNSSGAPGDGAFSVSL